MTTLELVLILLGLMVLIAAGLFIAHYVQRGGNAPAAGAARFDGGAEYDAEATRDKAALHDERPKTETDSRR